MEGLTGFDFFFFFHFSTLPECTWEENFWRAQCAPLGLWRGETKILGGPFFFVSRHREIWSFGSELISLCVI